MRLKLPLAVSVVCVLVLASPNAAVHARDDGRYANSPLKTWFDQLRSGKGPCCSDADGTAVSDVDWETHDGHYRVRLDNQWIDVPDDAVIAEQGRQDNGVADTRLHGNHDPLLHARQHDLICQARGSCIPRWLILDQRLPNFLRQFGIGPWLL